jgi:peptidoglycan/LPS O-acetylase OafA/YrhL
MVLSGGQLTIGNLCVIIFFFVSGFLITQSFVHSQNLKKFLLARVLRIFPALIFIVFATVFILGPIVSTESPKEYFSNPATYAYLETILLHSSASMGEIPSVFENNIYHSAVNGSLWTLEYEFICYLVVAFMGIFKMLNKPFAILLLLGSIIITHVPLGITVGTHTIQNTAYFLQYFSAGMLCFLYRDKIILNHSYAAISFIALAVMSAAGGIKYGLILFGTYLILYLVFNPKIKLNNTSKLGDFSYGLYIFAFRIQQTLTLYLYPNINPYTQFLLALPLTLLCSVFSWHLIEKKALKFKSKKDRTRTRLPETKEFTTAKIPV